MILWPTVHTWFSPLLGLNQVVCFRKTSLVCFFDCRCECLWVSVWACSCVCLFSIENTHTHTPLPSLRMPQTYLNTSNNNKKNPQDIIAMIIFHPQLSVLLGIQVIRMQAAEERVLKNVFLYGEWFVCFTFQLFSLPGPSLHYNTKTINHWWSDLLILLI